MMSKYISSKELLEQLSIPNSAILEAARRWKMTSEELQKGFDVRANESDRSRSSRFRELQDRYLSISRYCDDAERLISFHSDLDTDRQTEVFAIDPHILGAYAEPWDGGAHSGFRFFRGEGKDWSSDDLRFPVFTYAGLFRKQPAIILDAGRSELSDTISFFLRMAETTGGGNIDPIEFDHSKFIAELKEAFGDDARRPASESGAFQRLMLAGGQPELKQKLALARLIGVMKSTKFQAPELAIRSVLPAGMRESGADIFFAYLRFIQNNPAILNGLRSSMDRAYRIFRDVSQPSFQKAAPEAESNTELRGGELHDLNAIVEAHVLNTCLQLSDIPVHVNYVTLSLRMFNFVRQFDRTVLRGALLHPRSAIMLHDSVLFSSHKDEMTRVVASAVAFGQSIPKDGEINEAEIDKFEEKFGTTLESTKNTFIHALADSTGERARMVESIDRVLDRASDRNKQDWQRIRQNLESKLETQVRETGDLFGSHSTKLANEAWLAYEEFALKDDSANSIYVLVRRFVDTEKGVNRLVVLPVGGSYRYFFSIHNVSAVQAFEDVPVSSFRPILLKSLLERVDHQLSDSAPISTVGRKNCALKYFVRSIFAASHGQWALAEALATQAHDYFEQEDFCFDGADEASARIVTRVRQCDLEILFLRHMCRRALAYSSGPGRGRSNWLKKSASDLYASAQHTIAIDQTYVGNKTRTDPASVRQALAAFALQIEWVTRQDASSTSQPLECLPATELSHVAWSGLSFSDNAAVEGGSTLRQFGRQISARVAMDYSLVRSGRALGHSVENWRYFLLRCYMVSFALEACIDTDLVVGEFDIEADAMLESELDTALKLFKEHEKWEDDLMLSALAEAAISSDERRVDKDQWLRPVKEFRPSRNPFGSAVMSAARVRLNVSGLGLDGRYVVTNSAALLSSFANMDMNCHELNPFGFPRRVIRMVKKKYAPFLIEQFEQEYLDFDASGAITFGEIEVQ
jgi:hypothetical protein